MGAPEPGLLKFRQFRKWLLDHGALRQLYCLQQDCGCDRLHRQCPSTQRILSLFPDSTGADQRAPGCLAALATQADISPSNAAVAWLNAATAACAFSPATGAL